jgi:hypothetical protein
LHAGTGETMTKKTFNCRDIAVPHDQMISLRKLGKLNLGLDDMVAINISASGAVKNKSIKYAFNFWRFAALAAFLSSIYLSFTYQWWCFIPGLFVTGAMIKATNAGHVSNLLESAMEDRQLYENVRQMNGWSYQIEESDAAPYRTG